MAEVESKVKESELSFYDEILNTEDIGPFIDCMTCGKCVGDCIAAANTDFNFRQIIQKILYGNKDELINSDEIWKCFLCGLCTIKCPKNIQIKKLILILRNLALQSGKGCKYLKYMSDILTSFLKHGIITGRLNKNLREELGLPKEFKISEKTMSELKFILDETGLNSKSKEFLDICTREFMKSIVEGNEE
ncbi:MAG: 4Fe-4S dicluster domain-containing protein [Candidatus Helarchaeota archaeon]